jgi:putative ABC transport system substrate-binding protein
MHSSWPSTVSCRRIYDRSLSFAAKHRLPSIYGAREYADYGGLITYGPSDLHLYHRAATFVDKIFKGANPAELAIEQPQVRPGDQSEDRQGVGLTIPPSVLGRADRSSSKRVLDQRGQLLRSVVVC